MKWLHMQQKQQALAYCEDVWPGKVTPQEGGNNVSSMGREEHLGEYLEYR
jgi:hypothetical protein